LSANLRYNSDTTADKPLAKIEKLQPTMSPNAVATIERNYAILIETPKSGGYIATAVGFPNCQAKGKTRELALQKIRQLLIERLSQSEIVTLKIEAPPSAHPWMQFAGMFQNDPQFEDLLGDIQTYRQEIAEGQK
jgi:predicted RNase H-like HicB family nuclease